MGLYFINGSQISINAKDSIGKGGEAEVYQYKGNALKIFKRADHADLMGDPASKKAAEERIKVQQRKLPGFPRDLPKNVVCPLNLIRDKDSIIVGYEMCLVTNADVLLSYSDRSFRSKGVGYDQVQRVFINLFETVEKVHQSGVVLGDFNDLNVLVRQEGIYLVDADSFQFTTNGEVFYCGAYTNRFVDPTLCGLKDNNLYLVKPHNEASDWYAYAVMLMQSLLYVDPYGGIYKPANPKDRVNQNLRPLSRITVFHADVKYPKPAVHYSVLPDELCHYFYKTFVTDHRGLLNKSYLESMRWTTCLNCGMEHARPKCPVCAAAAPGIVTQVVEIRGQVTATREFATAGTILYGSFQKGKLRYLSHDRVGLTREGGLFSTPLSLTPGIRYRIHGDQTALGSEGRMIIVGPYQAPEVTLVDNFGRIPMFDTNSHSRYWIANGQLLAKQPGDLQDRFIGEVLQNQTLFWVGEEMGFGFYRAGSMTVAFTFAAHQGLLNDRVTLPGLPGQLIDSTCCFSKNRCWFFSSTQEHGKIVNRCYLITLDGSIVGSAVGEEGDGTWLGTIRGNCAVENFLLVGTDDGIVRVEASGDQLVVSKEFPDTEPWVSSRSNLFPGTKGVYVLSNKDVTLLKIK